MDPNNNRRANILVVDDIPVNIQLQKTYLSASGYDVFEAHDGVEALQKVRSHELDLILLDVMMPRMNGFQVCQKLKEDDSTKYIPIIMVTALNELEDKIKGIEAGADDFISKPFNKLELLARVKSLLRIKYLHDELGRKVKELEAAQERLKELAITDGLTNLYNHRHFKEALTQELIRAGRHRQRLALSMIDIDYFKHYNDTHGHPAGDSVLREIATLLKDNIRVIDVAARYGGEEFSLILTDSDRTAARMVGEKISSLVERHSFPFEESQPNGRITISMGISIYPDDGKSPDEIIFRADQRLYRAKELGRNRVVSDDNQH